MAPEAAADLVASCKDKLNHFRIKELKDVLHQLGLSKQGKKQELLARIVSVLLDQHDQVSRNNGLPKKKMAGKETVVKVVDDTFRKMQGIANTDAASRSQTELVHNVKSKKKSDDSARLDVKIRCPCGSSLATDSMIKCEDPQCNVWQHVGCVIIPEKPAEGISPEVPSRFYCEMCRISRADPFWVTINHPLLPMTISPCGVAADGSYTVQHVDKTFPLSRANREMLQKAEYDLQVWCVLLNDKVPFRMHWPLQSDMQVNGVQLRVLYRQPTQQLGANGRDDGLVVTGYCSEGPNKITLSRSDSHTFCLGARIARRRSVDQVLNLVPKEQDGEKFADAFARVRRCIGGGNEADNAESDSDIEVVADSVSVNLRCPMSGSRIKIAGRFKSCVHMGCFDLEAFVELNQRSRKWQCPICLKNYCLENIIIDPYFNRITSLIQNCGNDVTEIDVKPDGFWRVKGRVEVKDLAQWHLPDGTLCIATDAEGKPNMGIVKHETKQEPLSEELGNHLKLGIRKNNNGQWEISKTGGFNLISCGNDWTGDFENKSCITLRGNTGRNQESTEDQSVNLEPEHLDSVPVEGHIPSASKEHDIIVLSDSDDDNITTLSPSAENFSSACDPGTPFPSNPSETSGMFGEEPAQGADGTSYLGVNEGSDDLRMSFWEYPLGPQNDHTYQLFDSGTQVPPNIGEVQNYPVNCQAVNKPGSGGNLEAAAANPLEHGHDDALHALMPGETDGSTVEANMNDHSLTCLDGFSDKWISLGLGGADGSITDASNASRKRMDSGVELTVLDASVLTSVNDDLTAVTTSSERSHGPFSPPRHPRSVRQRLILSIDSDSD